MYQISRKERKDAKFFLVREEFKSIKYHAKNAKTQSFLGCKEFKNLIFYKALYSLLSLRLSALCEKIFFNEDEY